MSEYYNPQRTRNIYTPRLHGGQAGAGEPFKLSRSKIDLFLNCPRCFYLDRRLGIGQPPGYPFNLNSAVDTLLKKEFDIHRAKSTAHPLMKAYKLDLVPFQHGMMDEWRENFKGVQFLHRPTNLIITGAVDDLWVDKKGLIYIVDYKATSKTSEVNLDADWQIGYKRQMEVYQWLMRQNGFKVSDVGYFVYCNGQTDREAFDGKLEFDIKIIPYTGDDSWVEKEIIKAHKCLMCSKIPKAGENCDYCSYIEAVNSTIKENEDLEIAELYEKAKEIVCKHEVCSASLLQRTLKIGCAKSARIIDMLEQNGIIGPANSMNPHKYIGE